MSIQTFPLSHIQFLAGKFRLEFSHVGLTVNHRHFNFPGPEQICSLRETGLLVIVEWGGKRFCFFRQSGLHDFLTTALHERLAFWKAEYLPIYQRLAEAETLFRREIKSHQRYFRASNIKSLLDKYQVYKPDFSHLQAFDDLGLNCSAVEGQLYDFLFHTKDFQQRFNDAWSQRQLGQNQQLFDQLEAHPLTDKQRLACVTDEDSVLVIAGAGTGKTSTMVAKANYLVANGLAKPEEILMLAFGSDARDELQQRADEYALLTGLKVSTFHQAGRQIVSFCEGATTVSVLATDEREYQKFVNLQIVELLKTDGIRDDLKRFFGQYFYPQPDNIDSKTHGQYLKYVKDNEVRALSGDLVKSFEELEIANYLFSNGIAFEYEPVYPVAVSEPGRKAYQPDFYLTDLDVYLEHFGVDKNGQTRQDIDAEKYQKGMQWKRQVHQENATILWETYSWQSKQSGGLTTALEALIKRHCKQHRIPIENVIRPIGDDDFFAQTAQFKMDNGFYTLMSQFLSLFKASERGVDATQLKGMSAYNQTRWALFKKLFDWVYERYQSVLQANGTIDFADMISRATFHAQQDYFHLHTKESFRLKYLLVDEFQDISPIRASFIKAIRAANPGCGLMGVGDDWQAIYRFTGSDVRLTTQFEQFFGEAELLSLDKTFRFNDRIETVASTFVQKNPHQIAKRLKTHSKSDQREVHIITTGKDSAIERALAQIQNQLKGRTASVMFLARFKNSLPPLNTYKSQHRNLKFSGMSVHSAKGKQADFVIILDVVKGKYGFPSEVQTDPMLEILLPSLEDFQHAEERRLFYVALSRAKQTVFIQTQLGFESSFIKELKDLREDVSVSLTAVQNHYIEQVRCPSCLEGQLVPIEGQYGLFYACSLGKDYCPTIIKACPECGNAPFVMNETHYLCASAECGYKAERCPVCETGILKQRFNSKTQQPFLGCTNFIKRGDEKCTFTRKVVSVNKDKANSL
ncbi:UvrD-helicase domain-containing protein [uncultured Methylophaga sp.]|uniref:UvrD-helicase domain-containing protein n=1 Tax=uncultured Methylophaga sp. TaxID=285271 RepID=UPI00260CC514|nr:UvrD-helicase domain-containing protein [uncultured Methylophaga sp.]